MSGLYRGIAPLLYFSIPKVASRFWAYESLRNVLADEVRGGGGGEGVIRGRGRW